MTQTEAARQMCRMTQLFHKLAMQRTHDVTHAQHACCTPCTFQMLKWHAAQQLPHTVAE